MEYFISVIIGVCSGVLGCVWLCFSSIISLIFYILYIKRKENLHIVTVDNYTNSPERKINKVKECLQHFGLLIWILWWFGVPFALFTVCFAFVILALK